MLEQIEVPWRKSYDIGIGVDVTSGSPMNTVVAGVADTVNNAKGAAVDINVSRVETTDDLEKALGISAEASYGCGCFGAGISARFSFAQESKVQTTSLFLAVTVSVELASLSVDKPKLDPDAEALVGNPAAFATRYGNMFVREISRGGIFVGMIRIETEKVEESQDISADLGGGYGLFSAGLKTKMSDISKKYKSKIKIHMYHEGGPVDLQITDPNDPMQILENANRFLQSFQNSPDEMARPYSVSLAPISIANGALPPNAADIQNAQTVLVYCAKRRSGILDQLNLLDYMNDNQAKYDVSNGATWASVQTALQGFQDDLDLVGACASNAINNVLNARMPSDFAKDKGTTFPKAVFPPIMPAPKEGGEMVNVPDFAGCQSGSDCLTRADAVKLKLAYEHQAPAAAFRVIDVKPPKGTPVKAGQVVTIVCPATDYTKYKLLKIPGWHPIVADQLKKAVADRLQAKVKLQT
jgi:hypothetical protein